MDNMDHMDGMSHMKRRGECEMGRHNFDEQVNRVGTDSYKWDYEGQGGRYLPMGVADTDFKVPKEAMEAMEEVLKREVFGYGKFPKERFTRAVSLWYQKRHGVIVKPQWVSHSPGVMTAVWQLLHAFTNPGDKVVVQSPVYNMFYDVIEKQGRIVVSNDLVLNDQSYQMDFEDLRKKLSAPDVKIFLLCSPHNPVSRVWTREELSQCARIAKETDTLLISDEIHSDIVFQGHKHIPILGLDEEYLDHVILIHSTSKTFNLAAFYTAFVIIKNEALRKYYKTVSEKYHLSYNVFGLDALIACYQSCDYYVDEQNRYLEENVLAVRDFLREEVPKITLIKPEGTYLLWLDCRKLGLPQEELLKRFLEAGVRVNDGRNYGKNGDGFVRMNIATARENLEKAFKGISAVFAPDLNK